MAIIIVNNTWSRIRDLNNIELADQLDKITSFYIQGYQYTKAFREGIWDSSKGSLVMWDGKKHLLTSKMIFPTGLLERVKRFFTINNVEFTIQDERPNVQYGNPLKIFGHTPRPYQQEALEAAIKHGTGIIRVGTGGGKSLVAAMITAQHNVNSMIYVIGKDLLYQFHQAFGDFLQVPIGLIGDGHCELRKFNICSIWTAIKTFNINVKKFDDEDWDPEVVSIGANEKKLIKKAIEKTNVSIYDEAHYLGTETLQSIYKASKLCKHHFGLSGTDWRDDGADLLLESVCGRRIYNMPSSKLIEQGFLVPPKIIFYHIPDKDFTSKNYHSVYKNYIVENDDRNGVIEDAARKMIKMGRKVLILVKQLNHGNILYDRLKDLSVFFVNGEVDPETREDVKQAFIKGDYQCLIASSVYDIGVDIPCLDALIMGGGGKSSVRTLQRIGRVIRSSEGKTDAFVIDFIDNAKFLDKHSVLRLQLYQSEAGFKIKLPPGLDLKNYKLSRRISEKLS